MLETPYYTLEELFKMLGLSPIGIPWVRKTAKNILPTTTGELDWLYARFEVKKREDGSPEFVISIPFEIKGL